MTRNIAGRSPQRSLLCIACILMLAVFDRHRRPGGVAGDEIAMGGKMMKNAVQTIDLIRGS